MANVLVLGGGFGGVVAAESLSKELAPEHQITLVSRDSRFVFYPALVRLALGRVEPDDISYDLREALTGRRVRFLRAEVEGVDPRARKVMLARGEVEGVIPYDYLIFALGRRPAAERVPGFLDHAHHLLSVGAALRFGEAVRTFHKGHAVVGYCPGARIAVPVYETAFALSRLLEERGERGKTRITVVVPEPAGARMEGVEIGAALRDAFDAHHIGFLPEFPISRVTAEEVLTGEGSRLGYDLLMLIPPFEGHGAVSGSGITDDEGFIRVGETMRVEGADGMYAVGDCVALPGPKMGHMAVHQAEVAARNVAAEIEGREPDAKYYHDQMLVIDEGGRDSIYMYKPLWEDDGTVVGHGRFWHWAKWVHEKYWEGLHA